MAGILDWIDQNLGTRLGLLVNDPRAAMEQMNRQAGAYNQASLLAVQAERNALRGLPVTPEQAAAKQYVDKKIEDVAGGFAGTFIGKNAKLWDKLAEQRFLQLEKAGIAPEQMWKETGVFRGLDGKLRQEFSDKNSMLKGIGSYGDVVMNRLNALENAGVKQPGQPMTIQDIYHHPQMVKAYPETANIEAEFMPKGISSKGRLGDNTLQVQYNLPSETAKSVMLHEIQHAIQGIEGFSPGANSQMVTKADILPVYINKAQRLRDQAANLRENNMFSEATKKESEANKILDLGRWASYKRTPGEVEARLVQSRMNLTDAERRAMFPLAKGKYGLDVNPNKIKGLINY